MNNIFEVDKPSFTDDLLEAIQDGICVIDRDLRIVRLNSWIVRKYAHSEPSQGKVCYEVFQQREGVCPWCPAVKAMEGGDTVSTVVPYPSENEPTGWLELSAYPVRSKEGDIIGAIEYVKDITKQVKARRDLELLNQELDARVRERTSRLEAVNRELNSFAYSVSHDLRAPLRAVNGFSQALMEDCGKELSETAQHYLTRIREGTRQMARLIDGLLVLSRLSRSELNIERVDLSRVVDTILDELCVGLGEGSVELIVEPDVEAKCDRRLVRILLQNLISNALKFSQPKDKVHVEFGATTEGGEKVYFIKDKGVGFDMKYVDKLFAAFGRLHGAAEFPGNGIGLATVQRIVHRHGGRVWAHGEVGSGAVLFFTLGSGGEK